jgi:hypothetical protein
MTCRALALAAAVLVSAAPQSQPRRPPAIEVITVPGGGIQPRAVADSSGTVHLLYFAGDPAHGDLFYARRARGARAFSPALRVNSEPGSAIATGTVRGGRLALGRDAWLHVAWNGSAPVERDGQKNNPMWYTRISPRGAVEPQRPVGAHTRHLDGGGDVAADRSGRVIVVWHAAGDSDGETNRRIYVAASTDDGQSFSPEAAFPTSGGNCGCCQLNAMLDSRGRLQLLYRSAGEGVHRDAKWLTIEGRTVSREVTLQPWELPACPMTTFAMTETAGSLVAAWETAQQIYAVDIDPSKRTVGAPWAPDGTAVRKHPSVAVNAAGERLLAWTEGTAWGRGGTLAWELRSQSGRRLDGRSGDGDVPAWSLVAAVAMPDGSFVIVR